MSITIRKALPPGGIVSLVFGILSVLYSWVGRIAFFMGVPAVVFGVLGVSKSKGRKRKRAIWGLCMGGLLMWVWMKDFIIWAYNLPFVR